MSSMPYLRMFAGVAVETIRQLERAGDYRPNVFFPAFEIVASLFWRRLAVAPRGCDGP